MNEIIITDTLGNKTTTKVSDKDLENYRAAGIKFELIAKTEKPIVLKEKESEK